MRSIARASLVIAFLSAAILSASADPLDQQIEAAASKNSGNQNGAVVTVPIPEYKGVRTEVQVGLKTMPRIAPTNVGIVVTIPHDIAGGGQKAGGQKK
jgi:hypothetical protein